MGRVSLRKYNADIYAQSAIEAAIQLRAKNDIHPDQIESVRVDIFEAAHRYIGGGNGDNRTDVMNREEAAHSLPFLISAALIEGKIEPNQYRQRFIRCQEMQTMRERVSIHHDRKFTKRYPAEVGARITITDKSGVEHQATKLDYQGYHTRPMSWDDVVRKFNHVTGEFANEQLRSEIIETVELIERARVDDLTRLLARIEQQ